jgi:hypothetical protein
MGESERLICLNPPFICDMRFSHCLILLTTVPALWFTETLSPSFSVTHPALAQESANPSSSEIEPLRLEGRLERSSATLEDGSFYNRHSFQGIAGQAVVIRLNSTEFDTYLILVDPAGEQIAANDDSNGSNAQIILTLPSTGTYTVIANSYAAGEIGAYTLTLQPASPETLRLADWDWRIYP